MSTMFVSDNHIRTCIEPRPANSHKGTFGNVLSVCGSYGMAGAAYFAAAAALRCGAGLVTAALPDGIYPIVASMLPEAVYIPLIADLKPLNDKLESASAIVMGCGLGQSNESQAEMRFVLEHRNEKPIVLDADALNCIASSLPNIPNGLMTKEITTCMTPHPAEMARLLQCSVENVQNNRVISAESLSQKFNAVVVLKGHQSVIACPDRPTLINRTGCSGMATGGSGDVLAGMISSFIAQGYSIYNAAMVATYIHGLAGEAASSKLSEHGMLPSDMLPEIARILRDYEK